ncbi:MAG: 30S ribosomal protein S6e [Candidatus Woesearchaeota archaeon]
MAKFKLVLGDKSGKTKQIEVENDAAKAFLGKKIGQTIKGELIDMTGYEFLITGGSDNSGFPMRQDVQLAGKRKILIVDGVGLKPTRKGMRIRKMVAGAIIGENIAQINLKITKVGAKPLFEEEKPTEEEKKGE